MTTLQSFRLSSGPLGRGFFFPSFLQDYIFRLDAVLESRILSQISLCHRGLASCNRRIRSLLPNANEYVSLVAYHHGSENPSNLVTISVSVSGFHGIDVVAYM